MQNREARQYGKIIASMEKATKGSVFNVDSIGLYVGGSGSNGIRFKVYYCKNELFGDDAVMIADRQNNTSNTMYPISHKNIIEVKSEESLYIRIYPWLNNGGDSKSIWLQKKVPTE